MFRKALLYILFMFIVVSIMPEALAEADEWRIATVAHCDEWVSLRSSPDTSSERIARVPLGAQLEARVYDARFALCRYQNNEGYILMEYLEFAISAGEEEGVYVLPNVNEYLTLRSHPDSSSKSLAKLLPGERMRVLRWEDAFCQVEVPSKGMTGWVNSGYIMAENLSSDRWPYDYTALRNDVELLKTVPACEVENIGVTADGREIPVIRFGAPDAEHHVLIQAGMHAREIMTGRLAADLLLQLTEESPDGLEDVCLHVVPVVNPDGLEIAVHGASAIRDGALRSGVESVLRSEKESFQDWKANARCVDLNRNFDAGWDALKGRTPGSQRYRGEAPVSEPESRALVDYVERYPFDATISLHSKGSLIYWLGASGSLKEVNKSFVTCLSAATGYAPVTTESNVEKGGFKDWALECKGIPSVTIEIGCRESAGSLEEYSGILLRCGSLFTAAADWVRN